jgi:hypothetical protein
MEKIMEPTSEEIEEAKEKGFQYKLVLLKSEIEIIDRAIARLDNMTQTTKNWAIIIWSAVIVALIGQTGQQPFVLISAAVPVLFWMVDARWRYFLRGFIFRQDKIAEFLNSEDLNVSFAKNEIIGLYVLDPRGLQYRKTDEYKRLVNFWRAMKYPEVSWVYIGMTTVSIVLSFYFLIITT